MSCPDQPPFFIVGHPRSGTTLLRFMLSGHSRLYVPDETGFVPFLRVNPAEALTLVEVSAVVERIAKLNRFWAGMVADMDAFYAELTPPTLQNVLNKLYCQRIAPHAAVRWGDKTPLYVQYIPQIVAIWPDAKLIHVVRDGRDAALSARQKWPDARYMDIAYLLQNWVRNVRTGRRAGERLGSQYLEIRYEALVTEPEATLRRVCAFLAESFEPQMLGFDELARQIGGGVDGHVEAARPLSVASIGRWRQEMEPFERKVAARLAEPLLHELGYAPTEAGQMNSAETLHYAWLASKFRVVDTMRTWLYRAGVLTLNRNRRG